MATPDYQKTVVEALQYWLRPDGAEDYLEERITFEDGSETIVKVADMSDRSDETYAVVEWNTDQNPFDPDSGYQRIGSNSEMFLQEAETVFLTYDALSENMILWLPEIVLDADMNWVIDRGFVNQRFEYYDSFFADTVDFYRLGSYEGQMPWRIGTRPILNWTEVPESLWKV
jgi:hypothetical protein